MRPGRVSLLDLQIVGLCVLEVISHLCGRGLQLFLRPFTFLSTWQLLFLLPPSFPVTADGRHVQLSAASVRPGARGPPLPLTAGRPHLLSFPQPDFVRFRNFGILNLNLIRREWQINIENCACAATKAGETYDSELLSPIHKFKARDSIVHVKEALQLDGQTHGWHGVLEQVWVPLASAGVHNQPVIPSWTPSGAALHCYLRITKPIQIFSPLFEAYWYSMPKNDKPGFSFLLKTDALLDLQWNVFLEGDKNKADQGGVAINEAFWPLF